MMAGIAVSEEVEAIIREYRARTSPAERRRAAARKWRIEDTDEIRDHLVRDIEDEWEGNDG
jgi:hypothetical protein